MSSCSVVLYHCTALATSCSKLKRLQLQYTCTNINQTFVKSLHGLLNFEIGGIDCRVITTEYRTRVRCIHM